MLTITSQLPARRGRMGSLYVPGPEYDRLYDEIEKPREQDTTAFPLSIAPDSRTFIARGCRTVALKEVTANSPLIPLLFTLCQLAPKAGAATSNAIATATNVAFFMPIVLSSRA
jgi:hypothetical protein